MTRIRVKMNPDGARKLLSSPGMAAAVASAASTIAASAGPGFTSNVRQVGDRQRGIVATTDEQSRRAQAENNALLRAINSAQ